MIATRLRSTALARKRIARTPTMNGVRFRPQNPAATQQCQKGKSMTLAFSSSSSGSSSFFGRLWDRYTDALIANPLLVKGGAASVIFMVSDTATQAITDPEASWDASRALSGAGFGVAATCWLHYWWGFLEVVVNKRLPVGSYGQNKMVNALGKVVADQLVGAPLYIYSYYCVTHFGTELQSALSGNSNSNSNSDSSSKQELPSSDTSTMVLSLAKATSDRALEMLPDTLLRHWTLWPIIHTLNFYYNPIHHRVLVQNIVLIFWSGYLSHLNNGGLEIVTPTTEIELVASEHEQQRDTKQTMSSAAAAAIVGSEETKGSLVVKGGGPLATSKRA